MSSVMYHVTEIFCHEDLVL